MRYHVKVRKEGASYSGIFVDADGCMTQGSSREETITKAAEALDEWLRSHLENGRVPPRPQQDVKGAVAIEVDPAVAVAVALRWARTERGLNQSQLAKLANVSQQQIVKLEKPDNNPTIDSLKKVAAALGARVNVTLTSLQ